MTWTIYCHTHIESGRRYIGLTKKTMMQRWKDHIHASKHPREGERRYFLNAIRKYGSEAFSHEILEVCNSLEEANLAEYKWIEHFNTRKPKLGFNLDKGGSHTPHPFNNPWNRSEYRAKCLQTNKQNQIKATQASVIKKTQSDPAVRARLSTKLKIVMNTPEIRANALAAAALRRNIPLSPEHRAKIKAASRCQEPEVQTRISVATREAMHRPEVREKTLKNLRAKMATPEHRAKMSEIQRGRKQSPEHVAKVAAANKTRLWSLKWAKWAKENM
jgi:hypothetical protein